MTGGGEGVGEGEMGDPFLTPNKSRGCRRAGGVLKKILGTLELIFFRSEGGNQEHFVLSITEIFLPSVTKKLIKAN